MVAIHQGGDDGVGVGGAIHVDNKPSSDEHYRLNVVISQFLLLECGIQLDCLDNLLLQGFSTIGDDPINITFQSCKFLTLFRLLGHVKFEINYI